MILNTILVSNTVTVFNTSLIHDDASTVSVKWILQNQCVHRSTVLLSITFMKRTKSHHWFLANVTDGLMWWRTNVLSTEAQNALTLRKGEVHRLRFITVQQSLCLFFFLLLLSTESQSSSDLFTSVDFSPVSQHKTPPRKSKWIRCAGLLLKEFLYCIFTLWTPPLQHKVCLLKMIPFKSLTRTTKMWLIMSLRYDHCFSCFFLSVQLPHIRANPTDSKTKDYSFSWMWCCTIW